MARVSGKAHKVAAEPRFLTRLAARCIWRGRRLMSWNGGGNFYLTGNRGRAETLSEACSCVNNIYWHITAHLPFNISDIPHPHSPAIPFS